MQRFPGKIRFPGNASDDVVAVMVIGAGHLGIQVDDEDLGQWAMTDLSFEKGARGFHLTIDAEEIVLLPHDSYGFADAIEQAAKESATPTRNSRRKGRRRSGNTGESTEADQIEDPGDPVTIPASLIDSEGDDTPRISGFEETLHLFENEAVEEQAGQGQRPARLARSRFLGLTVGVLIGFAALTFPDIARIVFLIPGVIAVVLAGLGFLDQSFMRFLPSKVTELRLLISGVLCFAGGIAVATLG